MKALLTKIFGIIYDHIKFYFVVEEEINIPNQNWGYQSTDDDINNLRKYRGKTHFTKWIVLKIIEIMLVSPLVVCFAKTSIFPSSMEFVLTIFALNVVEKILFNADYH